MSGWLPGLPDHECVCDVRLRGDAGEIMGALVTVEPFGHSPEYRRVRVPVSMDGAAVGAICWVGMCVELAEWRPIVTPSTVPDE